VSRDICKKTASMAEKRKKEIPYQYRPVSSLPVPVLVPVEKVLPAHP